MPTNYQPTALHATAACEAATVAALAALYLTLLNVTENYCEQQTLTAKPTDSQQQRRYDQCATTNRNFLTMPADLRVRVFAESERGGVGEVFGYCYKFLNQSYANEVTTNDKTTMAITMTATATTTSKCYNNNTNCKYIKWC